VGRNPSRHVDPARGLWAEALCGCVPQDLRDAAPEEMRRDAAESVRLAYVAATRARDLLVLPVVGDESPRTEEPEGWFDVLHPAVYPAPEERRHSKRAPGCPGFGEDSVFERPARAGAGSGASVKPGLHRAGAGGQPVVWWDPAVLTLDAQEEVGLRQQRILEADAGEVEAAAGARRHEEWQARRRQALERGCEPSVAVSPVTEAAAGEADAEDVPVEETGIAERSARPGGRRFGTLVHAVLEVVDLGADAAAVERAARVQGRLLAASEEEVSAAGAAARAALAHPLLRRAAEAATRGELRRETPVLLRRDDGSLVEGVVDLAFREADGGAWTVIDFKTDRELGEQRGRYAAQLRLYARAIADATGAAAHPILLMV
jgi:ATP-dependent exoDNAse (exonuclease V) beta subunit